MESVLDVSYDRHLFQLFEDTYGPIGIAINALGVFLILLRSPREMGAYKWYLINFQVGF